MKRMTTYQMRRKLVLAIGLLLIGLAQTTFASEQTEVKDVVQRVFEQLRTHNYDSLYELLPNSSRSKLSRERFVSALERAQGFYQLDRLEIGSLKVQGNLAVVGIRPLGGETRGEALERDPSLGEQREIAYVDGRDDDAAPGVDLDELLLGERAESLSHRRAPEPEALHQLALADRGTRRQLEGDDQLPDAVVRLLTE